MFDSHDLASGEHVILLQQAEWQAIGARKAVRCGSHVHREAAFAGPPGPGA